jgi:glycosyltransferase involved in cell wall biosynthesis
MSRITIAIVTRNRSADLKYCLKILIPQLTRSEDILIVDNDSTDDTKRVVQTYAQKTSTKISYVFEKQTNISLCRNKALKESKGSWIAFIDDDCIPTKQWASSLRLAIKRFNSAAAIAGPNYPYDTKNSYSLATGFLYDFWTALNTQGDVIKNYEMLDTKNILYNKAFLKRNTIYYDTTLPLGEDCDLGIQIERKKGKAYYYLPMQVLHKHPSSATKYFISQLAYSLSAVKILEKWHPRTTVFAQKISTVSFLYHYRNHLRRADNVVHVYILILVTFAINNILFPIYSIPLFRSLLRPLTNAVFFLYLRRNKLSTTTAR